MYEIQKLNQRHQQIVDYYLDGMSNKDIAEALGMSLPAIALIVKSPQFEHEVALRREARNQTKDETVAAGHTGNQALEHLQQNALKAAQRLTMAVESENLSHSIRASESILDRIGIGKVEKQDITQRTVSINISAQDARIIADTMKMVRKTGS